jgi:hypothetical protein
MRYHRDALGKPWPLHERLWEAQRGLWLGLLEASILLACVLLVVEVVAHFLSDSGRLGVASLVFLLRWRGVVAVVFFGIVYRMWMNELELVNEDSETFEALVVRRLLHIEETLTRRTD